MTSVASSDSRYKTYGAIHCLFDVLPVNCLQLAGHPENQLPDLPLLRLKDQGNAFRRGAVPAASLLIGGRVSSDSPAPLDSDSGAIPAIPDDTHMFSVARCRLTGCIVSEAYAINKEALEKSKALATAAPAILAMHRDSISKESVVQLD
ncbi:MAG: hypothetical protein IPN53_26255 [Comamonadaceae bacterium]|nr:hypothetical protein [Comamonadaceae bacterium]